jgi:hypothetical protein
MPPGISTADFVSISVVAPFLVDLRPDLSFPTELACEEPIISLPKALLTAEPVLDRGENELLV